ncbi:hypothetical protein WN944_029141 [Citrus x changshan-huyou]|uniref:Uncharacterized protein n=1 Tax=Citrus x changshan-huyou TaxID=2935761 RepID=A0AAP0Q9L3_9ROSI
MYIYRGTPIAYCVSCWWAEMLLGKRGKWVCVCSCFWTIVLQTSLLIISDAWLSSFFTYSGFVILYGMPLLCL